jgi:L-ribulokinase
MWAARSRGFSRLVSGGGRQLNSLDACIKCARLSSRSATTAETTSSSPLALGIDFGTDSVRCLVVDLCGNVHGQVSSCRYASGTISRRRRDDTACSSSSIKGLNLDQLPPRYCLQDADDWVDALHTASSLLVHDFGIDPSRVQSIGVSFTASTVLPCDASGVPLYKTPRFLHQHQPHAW